jgi:EAL domain-containing protein (putative c-di-GMP-specific phosphodiesterase class I)
MRRAKALGGSRCEVFDEVMHRHAVRRLTLEKELQTALERGQFQLCYQPIFKLETRQITGFEALLRWHHPEQGVISPYEFIEVAENIGLIVSLGRWVIGEASQQLSAWRSRFPSLGQLSMTVNVSARQFAHAQLVSDIRSAIQESGIEPSRLQLEVAETAAMADPRMAFDAITQLKRLGACVSLGNFGTGLSSFGWLCRFPLDEVKIDRTLVSGLTAERANCDIVQLIITLARSLKLKLIAEGIETATHLDLLRKLGCEFGQGYLFSQPVDAKQAEEFLRQSLQARAKAASSE